MLQKLPVNNFERIEDTSQFDKNVIKNYNKVSVEEYFDEVDVKCPENSLDFHNDLPFLPERMEIEKV